jgi:LacI family transcriptional regulator
MTAEVTTKPAHSVTIGDVAEATGVSIRTVSRVLNDSPKVSAETRELVQGAIARLGFQPSLRARALASGRSFLIGFVQGDSNAHVLGVLQRGVVEVCSPAGYELLVHPADAEAPDLPEAIAAFVRRSRVDGLILPSPISENAQIPQAVLALGVPAVGLAAVRAPGYPSMVVSDEITAVRGMTEHLIGLGHRRIAMVTGPLRYFSARERRTGFLEAMAAAGLDVPPDYVVEGDYRFASGVAGAERLLSLSERPTAIFASNDIMAAAVLKVAVGKGLEVPRDLSVAGYDDSDIATMVTPSLTTIRRPLQEMARAAASQLLSLISGDPPGPDQKVALTLVTRASTAPPGGGSSSR